MQDAPGLIRSPCPTDISPPKRPRITDTKDTSISITWRAKDEPITGFLIEALSRSGGVAAPVRKIVPADHRAAIITGTLVQETTDPCWRGVYSNMFVCRSAAGRHVRH